jgi:TonB family protein
MKHKKNLTIPKSKLQRFIIGSVLIHATVALTIVLWPHLKPEKKSEVEVVLIEQTTKPEPISVQKSISTEKKPEQIVQTDENQSNNQLNENAKYLSAKNNTVKKETVAKNIGQFKNSISKQNAAQKTAVAEIEKQISNHKNENAKSKLFDSGFDAYASLNKNEVVKKMAQKEHSFQNGSSAQQASSTNDNIENTEPSLMTQLNTREYKYYGYHKRIRTQLDQWYESKLRDQMKKIMSQGRTIASEENKTTQLLIILNDKGNLVKIQVLGASGVRELDDAAVEAFRKAAPFPNPPKGMIDNDGTIKVRWDFVLS